MGRGTAASGIGPQLVWMNDTGTRILRLRVSGYGRQRMGKASASFFSPGVS